MDANDATGLLAAVGGGAVLVSGLAGALKPLVLPAAWRTGRAPMLLVAALALAAVILTGAQLGLPLVEPATWTAGAAAWLTVYAGAIGIHETAAKAVAIANGTTNRRGPDPE